MSTVDLEQWVNKPAKVTFKNGNTFLDTIQRVPGTCYYPYAFNGRTYTRLGLIWILDPDHKWTIVSITNPVSMKNQKAVDLSQWVAKIVKVTLRNGDTFVSEVRCIKHADYPYVVAGKTYTQSGSYFTTHRDFDLDIVSIEENPMATTKLQKQIEETQKHLEALQQELKKQQDQERFNQEFFTPVKTPENANACLTILKTKKSDSLKAAFLWLDTPQGYSYWKNINDNCSTFSDADFDGIKTWIINYLIQVRSEGKMVFS